MQIPPLPDAESDVPSAREQDQRFFDLSIDLLCFADYSGYFRRLNPAWERTLGFTRAELMARPSIEFVHPDDRERTVDQNRRVKNGGEARAFENRYRCKDGTYRWFLWNAVTDVQRQEIYSVARDITARREAEAIRERLVHDLQSALAEVRTLQQIMPICSYCRKIRDDDNYWQSVETYLAQHTQAQFSHSICPDCYATQVTPQLEKMRDA